jgi:uncharacterized protein (DUF1015 family)
MANIRPFHGIRFNSDAIKDLSNVVSQPYDKITPEMQEEYYLKEPHNVVRIILGKEEPGDNENENKYTRARKYFEKWLKERIIKRENVPSLYSYNQTYTTPLGEEKTRKGLVAHLKLEPLGSGVRPHEETLSKPKKDRFNLLKAARVDAGQIFLLYSDLDQVVNRVLKEATDRKPEIDLHADYGVRERLWVLDGETYKSQITEVVEFLSDRELLIADGHHRYETAIAFQDYQKSAVSNQQLESTGEESWNYRMVTLISMEDPGLVILPTHRLIMGLDEFELLGFLKRAEQFFNIESRRNEKEMFDFMKKGENHNFGVYGDEKYYLLTLRDQTSLEGKVKGSSIRQSLDVAVLHSLLIESSMSGLGISEEEVKKGGKIRYIRDPGEGVRAVNEGDAQCCLFLNPTRVEQVRAMAEKGERMPQKSTDFFPKLLSGHVMAEV